MDTEDEASVAAGTDWWLELTAAGGEGMVVKPLEALVRGPKGGWCSRASSAAAGSTCGSSTGRSTPGRTTSPACARGPWATSGRSRCASTRWAWRRWTGSRSGEPLWRVHEAVFAVLALESEPVDPRL